MLHFSAGGSLACLALLTAFGVSAQTPQTPITPEADRSAFESYQRFTEEKLLQWKDANDTVGRLGGWKVYAREAGESAVTPGTPGTPTTAATPATPVTPAVRDPHAGHGEKAK